MNRTLLVHRPSECSTHGHTWIHQASIQLVCRVQGVVAARRLPPKAILMPLVLALSVLGLRLGALPSVAAQSAPAVAVGGIDPVNGKSNQSSSIAARSLTASELVITQLIRIEEFPRQFLNAGLQDNKSSPVSLNESVFHELTLSVQITLKLSVGFDDHRVQ